MAAAVTKKPSQPEREEDEERPPLPDDDDAPPEEAAPPVNEAPMGFWTDLCAAVRQELKPPAIGFFTTSPNAPVQGMLVGDTLELRCAGAFPAQILGRPEILEVVARKACAMLGRPIRVQTVDMSERPASSARMEQLMRFGKEHSDVVKIRNNS